MTIKCFYGDYSSHENEQKMLDQFLTQLEPRYRDSDEWVYVIYNTMWNGQEVDLVCLTAHSIIVCDLKNYSGNLQGQENGEWLITTQNNETIIVKGGGQINPFVQVRKNRYAIMDWFSNEKLLESENIGHIAGLIMFSEITEIDLKLSRSVKQWFHVSDLSHTEFTLNHIHSNEINITPSDADLIVKTLNLQEYNWNTAVFMATKYEAFNNYYEDLEKLDESRVNYAQILNSPQDTQSVIVEKTKTIRFTQVYLPSFTILLSVALTVFLFFSSLKSGGAVYNWLVGDTIKSKHTFLGMLNLLPSQEVLIKKQLEVESISDQSSNHENKSEVTLEDKYQDKKSTSDNEKRYQEINVEDDHTIKSLAQLFDEKEKSIYGVKIGQTKLDTTPFLKKLKKYDDLNSFQGITQYQLNSNESNRFFDIKLESMNTKFPPIDIAHFMQTKFLYNDKGTLKAIIFVIDILDARESFPLYLKDFMRLGYEVIDSKIPYSLGDRYVVLEKNGQIVVINKPHVGNMDIAILSKSDFDKHKKSLVSKGIHL